MSTAHSSWKGKKRENVACLGEGGWDDTGCSQWGPQTATKLVRSTRFYLDLLSPGALEGEEVSRFLSTKPGDSGAG
jgi:hypothetical protein